MTSPSQAQCVLPMVQVDGWGTSGQGMFDPTTLVRSLLRNVPLVSLSLIHSKRAKSIAELTECVRLVRSELRPYVQGKQFYFCKVWRVRYEYMDPALQDLVQHDIGAEQLQRAFEAEYNADAIVACIYQVIGRSREMGVRAMLGQ